MRIEKKNEAQESHEPESLTLLPYPRYIAHHHQIDYRIYGVAPTQLQIGPCVTWNWLNEPIVESITKCDECDFNYPAQNQTLQFAIRYNQKTNPDFAVNTMKY